MKRTLSKVLSCILAVMMVLSVVSFGAFATSTVCKEGTHVSDGKIYGTEAGKRCYEYSFVTYKCTVCNQYYAEYSRALDANGHTKDDATVIKHEKVAATCNAKGTLAYYECTLCGWKSIDGTDPIAKDSELEIAKVSAHVYVADTATAVAPTMVNNVYTKGSMNYVCKYCGDTKVLPITCDHEKTYSSAIANYDVTDSSAWLERDPKKSENYQKASCSADGFQKFECADCGLVITITTKAAHVKGQVVNSSAATCTQEGYEVYICTVCLNSVYEKSNKLDHKYANGLSALNKVADATCDKAAQMKCELCKNTFDSTTEPALGHPGAVALPEMNKDKSATCDGKTTYSAAYYCSVCDAAKSGDKCTVNGVEKEYGLVYKKGVKTGTSHNFTIKVWTEKTTCVSDGKYKLQCTNCTSFRKDDGKACAEKDAEVKTETKSDAYHDKYDVNIILYATCTTAGEKQIACKLCSKLDGTREVIPATGHKGEGVKVASIREATCKEGGAQVESCSVCKSLIIVSTKALDHVWSAGIAKKKAAATCYNVGYKADTRVCELCDTLEFPENVIAKIDHVGYKVTVTASKDAPSNVGATCTKWGYKWASDTEKNNTGWYCTLCFKNGEEKKNYCGGKITDCSAPLNHDVKASTDETLVVSSTACGAYSFTTNLCTRCGFACSDNYVTGFGKKNDHHLVEVKNTSSDYQKYAVEGYGVVTTTSKKNAVAAVTATCTVAGMTIKKCDNKDCGKYFATSIVAKLAHKNAANQSFNEVVGSTAILCVSNVTDYKCTVCKTEYSANVVHGAKAVVVNAYAPTCYTPGYKVEAYECCNTYFTTQTEAKKNHRYTTYNANGVTKKVCDYCQDTIILVAAPLEFTYEVKTNAVNNGKLAVTISVENTSSAINVWSVSDKFNVPAGFTFDKVVSANSAFDVVSAVYGEDTHIEKKQIGSMNNVVYYEDVTVVDDRYVTFVARNSTLANVTVDGKVEIATLYFDIAEDVIALGTASKTVKFIIKDTYASFVGAYDAAGKEIAIQADDYNSVAFAVTVYNLGDINHDGKVTLGDFALILGAFDAFTAAEDMPEADINCDGAIDAADVALVEKFVTGAISYEEMIAG